MTATTVAQLKRQRTPRWAPRGGNTRSMMPRRFDEFANIDQPMFQFGLLDDVRDRVTGFRGVITGRTEWAYGCRRYSVQPRGLKNGHPVEAMGFDEMALVLVKVAPKRVKKIQRKKGGPHREPRRAPHAVPGR